MRATATLLAILSMAGVCRAGEPRWASGGPPSGSAEVIVVDPTDPTTVYTGTRIGVYRSTDAGESWERTSEDLRSDVTALVLDPNRPGTLYALSDWDVHRSTDWGQTWDVVYRGFWTDLLRAVPGSNPLALITSGDYTQLVRSNDGGETWRHLTHPIDPGLPLAHLNDLALLDADTGRLYAAVVYGARGGLYRSDDGGQSWSVVGPDRPRYFLRIACHPSLPDMVVANVGDDGVPPVVRSEDGGASWLPASLGLTWVYPDDMLTTLVVNPRNPSQIAAGGWGGLFLTEDQGNTWLQIGTFTLESEFSHIAALAFDRLGTALFVSGTHVRPLGISRSTDGGTTWTSSTRGLPLARIDSIAFDPTVPGLLYAGGPGLYRSRDGGGTWELLTNRFASHVGIGVAHHPERGDVLYATAGREGVARTTDAGATWSIEQEYPSPRLASQLDIDPYDHDVFYAVALNELYRTDDAGRRWSRLGLGVPWGAELEVDPHHPGGVFVASSGVYRSTDRGETWDHSTEGIWSTDLCPEGRPYQVWDLAFDPFLDSRVYIATERGVYLSVDRGATWTPSSVGLPEPFCPPPGPGYCSSCDGARAIAVDPRRPGRLFAAARDGVYVSLGGGSRWRPLLAAGLPPGAVSDLTVDPAGRHLYATPEEGGVYVLDLPPPVAGPGRVRRARPAIDE